MTYSVIIGIAVYCLIAGFTIGALFTDSNTNTNWKEAVICILAGLLWPLTIAAVIAFGLHDHFNKKRQIKKQIRNERLIRFVQLLYRMDIITEDTWYNIRQKMSEQQ